MRRNRKLRKQLTIATVEDSLDYSEILVSAIGEIVPNARIVSFRSGETFLAAVNCGEIVPDIVFLDLNLPSVSGHEVLRRFRQSKSRHAPVFIVTSSSLPTDVHQAYLESCSLYFLKPSEPDDLLRVLRDLFKVIEGRYTLLYGEKDG